LIIISKKWIMARFKVVEELDVYKVAYTASMEIFQLSKKFPKEETYSLTDQIRRSSRSVCANISEAFNRREYSKSFTNRLVDAKAEAGETKVWIQFCLDSGYIKTDEAKILIDTYGIIISQLVTMINQPDKWTLQR
jgi:four helix bundle protein